METSYLYPLVASLKDKKKYEYSYIYESYEKFIELCLAEKLVTSESVTVVKREPNRTSTTSSTNQIVNELFHFSPYLPRVLTSTDNGEVIADKYLKAVLTHGPKFYKGTREDSLAVELVNNLAVGYGLREVFDTTKPHKPNKMGEEIYVKNSKVSFTEPTYEGNRITPRTGQLLNLLDSSYKSKPVIVHEDDFKRLIGKDYIYSYEKEGYITNGYNGLYDKNGLVKAKKIKGMSKLSKIFFGKKKKTLGIPFTAVTVAPIVGLELVHPTLGLIAGLPLAGLTAYIYSLALMMKGSLDNFWLLTFTPEGERITREYKAWKRYADAAKESETRPEYESSLNSKNRWGTKSKASSYNYYQDDYDLDGIFF